MKSIHHIPSPSSPPFPLPLHKNCSYFTVLSLLLISKWMFKGVSRCIPTVGALHFGPFNPFHCSPFPLPSHPHFQQLSVHILMSSTCTDVMLYDITDALSFSLPFPPSPSSIEKFHCYRHVPHLSLCVIMPVLCICLFFGPIFHVWEKTWPLSSRINIWKESGEKQ
jgi:hypothetical protein